MSDTFSARSRFRPLEEDDEDGEWSPDDEFAGMTPRQVTDRIWATANNWTPEQIDAVEEWLADNSPGGDVTGGQYADAHNTLQEKATDDIPGPLAAASDSILGTDDEDDNAPTTTVWSPSSGFEPTGDEIYDDVASQLEGKSPEEVEQWLADSNLTPDELEAVQGWIRVQHHEAEVEAGNVGGTTIEGSEWGVAYSTAQETEGAVEEEEAEAEQVEFEASDEAQAAAQQMFENTPPGVPIDLSQLEQFAPEGMSPAERNRWVREQAEAGKQRAIEAEAERTQASEGVDEDTARRMAESRYGGESILDTQTPRWMLEMFQGEPSPEQKQRFLDYYNDMMGTNFFEFEQVIPDIQEQTQVNGYLAESAMLAVEPMTSFDVEIPFVSGRQSVTLSTEEVEAFRDAGWGMDATVRLVRLANLFPGYDPNTGENRTPDLAGTAMIARTLGVGDSLEDFNRRQQEIEQLEAKIADVRSREREMGPGAAGMVAPMEADLERLKRQQAIREEKGALPSFLRARNDYNRGLDKYGQNQTLAFIYSMDQGLAERIVASGGDPEKLDLGDSEQATQLLMDAGVINRDSTWAGTLGLRSGDNVLRQFGDYFAATGGGGGGGGGGAGRVRRMVDPTAVQEQVGRLWQAMFRAQPSEDIVKAFTNELQASLDKAPQGMEFDVSARIQEWLKGQAIYDELYGAKPTGVTEEEYQGQFAAAQQSILGSELTDDQAILEGMKTGLPQTTVGAAAASKQAIDNSQWLGRLARAGQLVQELT